MNRQVRSLLVERDTRGGKRSAEEEARAVFCIKSYVNISRYRQGIRKAAKISQGEIDEFELRQKAAGRVKKRRSSP